MPYQDMPRPELDLYRPAQIKEPDFDQFWQETLEELRAQPLRLSATRLDLPVSGVTISRAVYEGFGGAQIHGWLLLPERREPVPGLVCYHGYGWYRQDASEYLGWALQGYAVLAVDVRGQSNESGDPAAYPEGHAPGFMTQGILDPRRYYYRYVYADAVRAVDVLAGVQGVDPARIGVLGSSQGGALTLAAAALHGSVRTAMAGVPFLCHFERAVEMADAGPYPELTRYLRLRRDEEEAVFRTLRYIDLLNLADRITCPTLITVGLRDPICPPSTVFAVYNTLAAHDKRLEVYPYHEHDLGLGSADTQLRWVAQHLRG